MEKKQKQQYPLDNSQKASVQSSFNHLYESGVSVPGVEVVRSNTPRPISIENMLSTSGYWQAMQTGKPVESGEPVPTFPARAPSAPPLPEELSEEEVPAPMTPTPISPIRTQPVITEDVQEFAWLFEYGLEMDPVLLNGSERLRGMALLYGPAVLRGYTLMMGAHHQRGMGGQGQVAFAITPAEDTGAEVWGVLYRIPHHLIERRGEEVSLLDMVHSALPPYQLFQSKQVTVYETYRDQQVLCLTYVATEIALQQLQLVEVAQWDGSPDYVQRLAAVARKQKLPENYIKNYTPRSFVAAKVEEEPAPSQAMQTMAAIQIPPSTLPLPPSAAHSAASTSSFGHSEAGVIEHGEHDTDPLPAFQGNWMASRQIPQPQMEAREVVLPQAENLPAVIPMVQKVEPATQSQARLIIFSLYLVILLLAVLTFAIVQGLGLVADVFTQSFAPLGVPWLVMLYGLLGGCLSSVATLHRLRTNNMPLYVVIAWYTRPFLGAVLALFMYILLTSGVFVFGEHVERHMAFFWFAGGIAGLSEGWLFFRRRWR